MGNNLVHFNIGSSSTGFKIATSQYTDDGAKVCNWCMAYTLGENRSDFSGETSPRGLSPEANRCCFALMATRSNNGIESVILQFSDTADNMTAFQLKIERDSYGGLCGRIHDVVSSGRQSTSTRAYQNCVIETTILSYGCSRRDGLFVLEKKKNVNYENAYLITLAHYYITKDVGLSVVAKIHGNKVEGFGVEVEHTQIHPSSDLRMVLVQTCSSGVWTPSACSHCSGAKPASSTNNSNRCGCFGRCFKPRSCPSNDNQVSDPIDHPSIWSNIDEQSNNLGNRKII